ncbi:P-loop NTPase [Georgenia halophila]|uniref:P-loop NTPase n=1 Tax=Georgenia halophila TaxID=620889 RepID=A0ABP8KUY4_9MICO
MNVGVLLALSGPVESELVRLLDAPRSGVRVVRRCADVPEVLAAAGAGLGSLAVVGADLHGVDRSVITRLRAAGTRTVLVAEPGDLPRCAALGADAVEPVGVATALAEAVLAMSRRPDDAPGPQRPGTGPGRLPDREDAVAAGAGAPPPGAGGFQTEPHDDVGRGAAPDPHGAAEPGATEEPGAPGKLVVVWGPPGAPGRTTLAVTLAAELATLSERALLVDADTEAPSVTQVLGILDDASAVASAARQALAGRLGPGSLLRACPIVDGSLHVMTGLTRADRWREVPAAALEVIWDVARATVPWTVVDTGSTLESDHDGFGARRYEATASALAAADVLVVVGAGDPVGMRRLVMALGDLGDAELSSTARRVVVVNHVRPSAAGSSPTEAVHEALVRFAGVGDAVIVPEDRLALDKAVVQGRSLPQVAPASPARAEIEQLARWLAGERSRTRRRRGRLGRPGKPRAARV